MSTFDLVFGLLTTISSLALTHLLTTFVGTQTLQETVLANRRIL
jgi:hypothetical protein